MRRGGEEQSYLRSYLRVIFVYIGKRAEITSFTLFALPPYVGYPPLTPKLACCIRGCISCIRCNVLYQLYQL